jgi:hypothetical protein
MDPYHNKDLICIQESFIGLTFLLHLVLYCKFYLQFAFPINKTGLNFTLISFFVLKTCYSSIRYQLWVMDKDQQLLYV